jgi:hypothetical protein
MLIPADVCEWRGRLSTKAVTENSLVIVRVIQPDLHNTKYGSIEHVWVR